MPEKPDSRVLAVADFAVGKNRPRIWFRMKLYWSGPKVFRMALGSVFTSTSVPEIDETERLSKVTPIPDDPSLPC
jgi:hypothetical protein